MFHPHVRAVGVFRIRVHHGGVSPTRCSFHRNDGSNRLLFAGQQVDLERPGAGSNNTFVLEVIHLNESIVPVATNELALFTQQIQSSVILILIQLIGAGDAQFGFVIHQEVRGIGNVNGAVIGLNPAFVGLTVGQGLLFKHHGPACGRFREHVGVVHQHVRAPHVGRTVVLAVHRMPGGVFQAIIHRAPTGDQVDVDFLHPLAGDETERRVPRCRDEVKAPFVHKGDHFV